MTRVRQFGAGFGAAACLLLAQHALAQEQPLAVFLFDAGSTLDATGNGVTLTPTGTPLAIASGYEGGAFRFDGLNQSFRAALNINPSAHPRLTMGCWVRPALGTSTRHLLSHDNGGYDRDICIDTRGGGLGWSAFRGSGVLGYIPVVVDQWVFVAAVYDATANTVRLHVGDQVRSSSGTPGVGNMFVDIANSPCCDLNFAGDIDNVFFIDGALSTTRIEEIRTRGAAAIPLCATIWDNPDSLAVCPGGTATLSVVGAGSGELRYQWRHAEQPIDGATGPQLTITDAGDDSAGVYDCVVTNDCRSVTSAPANVTICPPDFNCDGVNNSQDFFDFLGRFFSADPRADFNRDGAVNSQDFFDFVVFFFAGC